MLIPSLRMSQEVNICLLGPALLHETQQRDIGYERKKLGVKRGHAARIK